MFICRRRNIGSVLFAAVLILLLIPITARAGYKPADSTADSIVKTDNAAPVQLARSMRMRMRMHPSAPRAPRLRIRPGSSFPTHPFQSFRTLQRPYRPPLDDDASYDTPYEVGEDFTSPEEVVLQKPEKCVKYPLRQCTKGVCIIRPQYACN